MYVCGIAWICWNPFRVTQFYNIPGFGLRCFRQAFLWQPDEKASALCPANLAQGKMTCWTHADPGSQGFGFDTSPFCPNVLFDLGTCLNMTVLPTSRAPRRASCCVEPFIFCWANPFRKCYSSFTFQLDQPKRYLYTPARVVFFSQTSPKTSQLACCVAKP